MPGGHHGGGGGHRGGGGFGGHHHHHHGGPGPLFRPPVVPVPVVVGGGARNREPAPRVVVQREPAKLLVQSALVTRSWMVKGSWWDGGDEEYFEVNVRTLEGAAFQVTRKYSDFKACREKIAWKRADLYNSFPKYPGVTSIILCRPTPAEDSMKLDLNSWLCTYVEQARRQDSLQGPLYALLDFHANYQRLAESQRQAEENVVEAEVVGVSVAQPASVGGVNGTNTTDFYTQKPDTVQLAPSKEPTAPSAQPAPTLAPEDDWEIRPFLAQYRQQFDEAGPDAHGKLVPAKAQGPMAASRLPSATLAQIWERADMDKDGLLDFEEFAVAMYLCRIAGGGLTYSCDITFFNDST
eukprot:CAMPEP_0113943308 /NCGR_PEP_ID=MMETSP1339-20121228/23176_1 /TAXON_ID=94617 /ORGANISM="Fibrocapsa japonica" /LENGTH=351 /DNA_ID=CAMNT_0000948149 /DNA_START=94 /DNA_END=1151 /DNA_ORIENTATION=- /assembly_acc=CAM_ASM_000762